MDESNNKSQFIKENYDTRSMSLKKLRPPQNELTIKERVCVCMCVFGGGDLLPKEHHVWGTQDSETTPPPAHIPMCNWLKQYLTMCGVL